MRIVSQSPFPVLPLVWEPEQHRRGLTVIVKATFRVAAGRAMSVAPSQEPLGGDRFWGDDPRASLFAPSDWVPAKSRPEVMVVGHAYAPRGAPGGAQSLQARIDIGAWSKSVRVTGDRLWTPGPVGLVPGQPVPFARTPLRDELAPRSADRPLGFVAAQPIVGTRALPNLEGTFGPLLPQARPTTAPRAALAWGYRLSGSPPPGFDFSFFNAAPLDQRLDVIPVGAKVMLHHLHPEHAVVTTYLPSSEPRALLMGPDRREPRPIALRCDTVWVDADRAIVVLTYRGLAELVAPPDAHELSITFEGRAEVSEEEAVKGTFELSPSAVRALAGRAATPFQKPSAKEALSDEEVIGTVEVGDVAPSGPALPFREESAAAVLSRIPLTAPPSDEESPAGGTSDVRYVDLIRRQHPFGEPFAAPNAPSLPSAPAPESAPPAPVVAVPLMAPPPVSSPPSLAAPPPVSAPPAPSISKPLSIEGYAAVSAALVLKRPLAEALEREGVTRETWDESALRWKEALTQGRDVKAYDGAFVAALERLRGPFGAIDYAAITVGLERGKAGELGAHYQLGPADLMRVQRVGALRAAADPSLAAAVSAAAAAARRG